MTTILLRSVQHTQSTCRSCGAPILWAVTQAGRNMPLNAHANLQVISTSGVRVATADTHWATCPHAKGHHRGRHAAPSERID